MKKFFIIIFSLAAASTFSQQGWVYLNPTPDGISRYGLQMFSETSGICRSNYSLFKTNDAGQTWRDINLPAVDQYLEGVSIIDSSLWYFWMASNRILKTTNGGESWSYVSQLPLYNYYYNSFIFISNKTGFCFFNESSSLKKLLKTTNDGLNWNPVFISDSININNIKFINSTTGFAAGFKYSSFSQYRTVILKTTNGGTSWDSIPNTLLYSPTSIYFLNENTGFLNSHQDSYNGRLLRTTDGGQSWKDTLKYFVQDLKFSDSSSGYFLANDTIIGKTTNAGNNWTFLKIRNQTINSFTKPAAINFLNSTTCISVGTLGINLRTTNSGSTWINSNNTVTYDELDDIIFKNENTGFAMGFTPNIFKTTNAGVNWTKITLGNSGTSFGAMAYAGGNTWYLTDYFSNNMYKTTNDGLNWNSFNAGFGGVTAMQFFNNNTGFGVCKYNRFFKTTNGGLNWFRNDSLTSSQNFNLNFIDENTGYIGGGQLRKTTNGGLTFDTIPRNIIYNAWDVKFLSRDTIIVAGITPDPANSYYKGTVWKSTNAGLTWNAQYISHQYISGPLRFPNSRTGYISDNFGSIFKTTNAGDNWFQIKAPEGYLYGMNFINAETGYVCGNYGIIAKTTDGGASTFISSNETVPNNFSLHQNYPNPFNPTTKIKFDLPKDGNVKIIIFDILGREMETLINENFIAGGHEVQWNASAYSAGVYFYMLLTDDIKETRKMILIK